MKFQFSLIQVQKNKMKLLSYTNNLPPKAINPSMLLIPVITDTVDAVLTKISGWAGKNLSLIASLSTDGINS